MAESGTKGTISDTLQLYPQQYPSTLSSTISATALQDGEDAVTSLIEENGWEYIKENASLEDIDALTFIHLSILEDNQNSTKCYLSYCIKAPH